MTKNTIMVMTEILIEEQPKLSLDELCSACHVSPEFIQDMVDYGILDLPGGIANVSEFNTDHLRKVRITAHLQQDLEVNLAGAALVIDLMYEMEDMRARVALLEKQLKF